MLKQGHYPLADYPLTRVTVGALQATHMQSGISAVRSALRDLIDGISKARGSRRNFVAGLMAVLWAVGLTVVTSPLALAADKVETYTGYVVDKSCAAMIKNDHLDPMQRLKDHTKSCALEPSCCEAGYTVYSGGKWIDLDVAGSAMAQKMIKASKKSKAHMCKITGVFKRNEFHATDVTEVN
jgi:hypothetical protein